MAKYLKEHGMLEKIVAAMNESIKIPYDIRIVTTTSPIGPYYSNKTIYLDYGFMLLIERLYEKFLSKPISGE